MNRCLAEGRRAFLERVAGIEAGAECERLVPLLSALADGEADADGLARLRPHLRTCLACRSRLREFRATPARVAALSPAGVLAAADPGGLRGLVESIVAAAQHKAATLGDRAHSAIELATGQKVAAVAASAAALAGGGSAVDQLSSRARQAGPPLAERTVGTHPAAEQVPAVTPAPAVVTTPQPAPPTAPAPEPAAPPPAPAQEFDPAAAAAAPAPTGAVPAPETAPAEAAFAPGAKGDSGGGGGSGEFGP